MSKKPQATPSSQANPSPRISEAEWEVMHAIWSLGQANAQDVVQALRPAKDWSDRTVKTLLARLVKKGALGYEAQGKRYLYRPLVERDACVQAESDSFIERVCGGTLSPLLASFVRTRKLSAEEIRELKRLLEDQEERP